MQEIPNQLPEQLARERIDTMLHEAGWAVQGMKERDLFGHKGVALRENSTTGGFADYVLYVDAKPVGIIEAKRKEEGQNMTVVADQSQRYAAAKLKHLNNEPLPFVYESTGTVTFFTDNRDPKPRSREVFHFHRPETLEEWLGQPMNLRARLQDIPDLSPEGLRPAQIKAIVHLEKSFKENRPKALIQMATGAGKTFTACTFAYRLLKHANAKRILFLVDTRNLGKQAEQEFQAFRPKDDNRGFTELYSVQRLTSSYIDNSSQVCISTIQRLYSILSGKELDESLEDSDPNDSSWMQQQLDAKKAVPVAYNPKVPIEQFDFIVIDECHRSIYNLWKQVLDYFDAYLIGLTATPDKRTFAFFDENVVSEYTYEESVTDGVNVPYDIYMIETEVSKKGAVIESGWYVERREKLSRAKRWQQEDVPVAYSGKDLDKSVVNPSQIRNIIREFKRVLPIELFRDRVNADGSYEVPKTLIFAKTDSHADDIIRMVREEFAQGDDFCKKVTYKAEDDPDTTLSKFRTGYNPRIVVTVDMIATGTDVKPLEVLLFMRDVKSINYFEQMKGRGARSMAADALQQVSATAKAKTHFVIVDAVGATKSKKTDSRPLERKHSVPMKDLMEAVGMGVVEEDLFLSLANRLLKLERQLTPKEQQQVTEATGGKPLRQMAKDLLDAFDPDAIASHCADTDDGRDAINRVSTEMARKAASAFTGKVTDLIEKVRQQHEQIIDTHNIDTVTRSEWDTTATTRATAMVKEFGEYMAALKDEMIALRIYYDQPYRRRDVTFRMLTEVLERLKADRPQLAPLNVWMAYEQLEQVQGARPKRELTALISLLRRVCGMDERLTDHGQTIDRNFQRWVFDKQAGPLKFTDEQMQWLRMIKDHVAQSFHIEVDDLDYTPFDAQGGRGRMYKLFGDGMTGVIEELNEALAA
jgi:type I restriction enzyme, R subunit